MRPLLSREWTDGTTGEWSTCEVTKPEENPEKSWADALNESVVTSSQLRDLHLIRRKRLLGDWFCEGDLGFIFSYKRVNSWHDLGTAGTYLYLFAKYDGPNGGSEVWYVGGLSGVITIPAFGLFGQNYGLSGWTLFGSAATTPDGGTTVMLLGAALGALGMARRFLKA